MLYFCLSFIARFVLSARYRVQFNGLDFKELKDKKSLLFLPNHSSKLDMLFIPLILIQKRLWFRPVAVEYLFPWPLLRSWLKKFRAIPIPRFKTEFNQDKVVRAKKSLQEIARGLHNGDNFLLFPSGATKKTGVEILGANSGAYTVVQQCPEALIVLIRITGFWGSSFSNVRNEKLSAIKNRLFKGIKVVLKNGIFFTPKRLVTIDIEWAPSTLKQPGITNLAFNRILEDWYNRYRDSSGVVHSTEPLTLIPYYFWEKSRKKPKIQLNNESVPNKIQH